MRDTIHNRRSIRLTHYDYTQAGTYFVTICTHERSCTLGTIADEEMILSAWGNVAQSCWDAIPSHFPIVELDAFVVMPNHVHGIIVIVDVDRRGMIYHAPTTREFSKPIASSLSTIVGTFKAAVTRHIRRLPNPPDHPPWQRNYYEHIVRDDDDLSRIRQYIEHNVAKWQEDSLWMP